MTLYFIITGFSSPSPSISLSPVVQIEKEKSIAFSDLVIMKMSYWVSFNSFSKQLNLSVFI
jgi:hypothetical protein